MAGTADAVVFVRAMHNLARFEGEGGRRIAIGDRTLEFISTIDVRSDAENFHVKIRRTIHENGDLVRERTWSEAIPREFN